MGSSHALKKENCFGLLKIFEIDIFGFGFGISAPNAAFICLFICRYMKSISRKTLKPDHPNIIYVGATSALSRK